MSRSNFIVTPFAALVLVFIGASVPAPGVDGTAAAAWSSDPCSPNLSPPPPTTSEPKPAAPKNLRIIGGVTDQELLEPEFEVTSGPHAWPEPTEAASASSHAYFDMLVNRPDCMTSFHYRTQANVDLVGSRAEGDKKIPIVYDAAHDAAKFEIDPSGSLPSSGSTGTPQKRLPIEAPGATSLLITWDLKIDESMRYQGSGYLGQHKSHRLDNPSASAWLAMKQNYSRATNQAKGVAMFFFTITTKFLGEGSMQGGSETLSRIGPDGKAIMPPEFYIQPDTWTRVWVLLEGEVSTRSAPVQLSVWLADEQRNPVQLYDRINVISPDHERGVGIFRYEFDSSTSTSLNGPGQQYQRNFVVLRGVTKAEVVGLLQKPVK